MNVSIAHFAELQRKSREGMTGEIKLLTGFDTNGRRSVYLDVVLEKRGAAEYERLRKAVWEYMRQNGITAEPLQEGLFA